MKRREYLNNLLIKSKDELIGRKVTFVDTSDDLILYLDNGKLLIITIEIDGWGNYTKIDNELTKLLGIINYGKKSKLYLEEHSDFNMEEYIKLID